MNGLEKRSEVMINKIQTIPVDKNCFEVQFSLNYDDLINKFANLGT